MKQEELVKLIDEIKEDLNNHRKENRVWDIQSSREAVDYLTHHFMNDPGKNYAVNSTVSFNEKENKREYAVQIYRTKKNGK